MRIVRRSFATAILLLASAAAAPSAAAARAFDACSLLTNAEIRAVQRDPVASTKSTEPQRERFAVSQCFFTLTPFSKSISLEVTRRRPGEREGPRDYWKQLFKPGPWKEKDSNREKSEGEEEGEKSSSPPRRVRGVGDDAYWVGPPIVGGLYVLVGDSYFRISIGGPDTEPVKIAKLSKLARNAARRLR
jgi:hypothetical protein